jgi:hypothetical protein
MDIPEDEELIKRFENKKRLAWKNSLNFIQNLKYFFPKLIYYD